jgi:peptide/nickel transport system ATP-binding protein
MSDADETTTPGATTTRDDAGIGEGPDTDGEPLLSVRDLQVHFDTREGTVRAVDGVSFDVHPGEVVCVVGESGSGKTVTAESITQLIDMPPGRIAGGEVIFDGQNLAELSDKQLRSVRGSRIGHIFQNPQGALNPVYSVGWQIREAVQLHRDVSKGAAREEAIDLLDRVGIPSAAERVDEYPHEFSGGMRQRVVIAMALAARPDLLIADEPTTALDVTIQAQILRLLKEIQEEFDTAIVFITHDLGVVAEMADKVVVMYSGKVMERGDVYEVFEEPAHPYTQALLRCLPGRGRTETTEAIGGSLPDPTDPPDGCRFHPRCSLAVEDCTVGEQPPLEGVDLEDDPHVASCIFYQPGYDDTQVRQQARDLAIGGADGAETRTDGGASGDDPTSGGDPAAPGGDRR